MDCWDPQIRAMAQAMIPECEGKPFVHVDPNYHGGPFVCRCMTGIGIADDMIYGTCRDWVSPRPDGQLTERFWISCELLKIGVGWFQDKYFGWYFVFDEALVSRSLKGDHTWVKAFINSAKENQARPSKKAKPSRKRQKRA